MEDDTDRVDKAVSTDGDLIEKEGWRIVHLETLLTALVDTKLMIIKAGLCHGTSNKNSLFASYDRRRQKRCRKQHCHHRHGHKRSHSREGRRKDDDFMIPADCSSLDLSGRPDIVDIDFSNHSLQDEFLLDRLRLPGDESHYITMEMEELSRKAKKKRRRKRKSSGFPKQKIKVADPSEMSKRARWTILITAGLLIFTCMLLVGVTLRMAPIIDQMVRTQNEELVRSLNRQEFNESLMYA